MRYLNWTEYIDEFGKNLLNELGYDPNHLPSDHNPITRALRDPNFVETYKSMKGFSATGLNKVALICQSNVWDNVQGPDNDGELKAMRRHWYAWFKTQMAQPLSVQLGQDLQDEKWGKRWFKYLSVTFAYFIDNTDLTYADLWVKDASRMMDSFYGRLFQDANILICVEKDSLLKDYEIAAKAIGARAIYSGKGKSSKAGIEKLLRDTWYWSENNDPFTQENPLIVLSLTDHDFDGQAVIAPTFAEQARKYTPHVREARIGVHPEQVPNWLERYHENDVYQIKLKNSGYRNWASKHALFVSTCENCGNEFVVKGASLEETGHIALHNCPQCGRLCDSIVVGGQGSTAFGFEVEVLKTRTYYGEIVDALLTVLDFDYLLRKLRDECMANVGRVVGSVKEDILSNNESYQAILDEIATYTRYEQLVAMKEMFEAKVENGLTRISEPHQADWRDLQDDPTPDDFSQFVASAPKHIYTAWRPFDERARTAKLEEWVRTERSNVVDAFERYDVNRLEDRV